MQKRFNILSLIGSLGFGGAENRLLSIARHIDRKRFQHKVAVLDPIHRDAEEASAMLHLFKEAGVEVMEIPEVHAGKISRLARRIQSICLVLKELNIDLIDCHCEPGSLVGTFAGVAMSRPRIVTLYHPDPLSPPRFWGLAKQFILTTSNLIISDSSVRALEIQNAAFCKRPEVAVIPNGISPPRASRTRSAVLRLLNIPPEQNIQIVAQVSTLRDSKGQFVLLNAAKRVLEKQRSSFFMFVGYEKDAPGVQKRLKQRAIDLGIADRVWIGGYPGPIGDIWSLVDVHVHASLFDSLPNAIIEGMSLGKPAIVTSVGGIPEAVIDGQTGLIVPPGDPVALASALNTVLGDPALSNRIGQASLRRYTEFYRPELFIRKIESCFCEVINGCSAAYSVQKSSTAASSS